MRTKQSLLLGAGEGVLLALLIPFLRQCEKMVPEAIGVEIPQQLSIFLLAFVVIATVLLVTNNVRKYVFHEAAVPWQEHATECASGLTALFAVTAVILTS